MLFSVQKDLPKLGCGSFTVVEAIMCLLYSSPAANASNAEMCGFLAH